MRVGILTSRKQNFGVVDSGKLDDLVNEFDKLLAEDPHAGGDPTLFNKRILLLIYLHERRKEI